MLNSILKLLIIFCILFLNLTPLLGEVQHSDEIDCRQCHLNTKLSKKRVPPQPQSAAERAIGILDKGQLTNYFGNYGNLAHYLEYLNDALHWPTAANQTTQYGFGIGLVVAAKGNVITSVLGAFAEKIDWVPKDGSRGQIFSGDITAPPPDLTPFLPMSDNPETWPEGYRDSQGNWVQTPGQRRWPGYFRIDIDPTSLTFGQEVLGEFVSDRDIYCVYDDSRNYNPAGSVGIEVEQTAYSFGRPYAEDLLFFDFRIHNKSDQQLDSVYVGFYTVFRPDYDFQDYLNIIDSNPADEHPNGNFVYVWDKNNIKDGAWEDDPTDLGMIGLGVFDTPKNMGVTDFHFFNREVSPKTDERMWAVITSNPADPNLDLPQAFFHGSNRRFDTTHPDSMQKYFPDGAPLNFYIMTGPFSLEPDEFVNSSMGFIIGSAGSVPDEPDTTDLMKNLRTAVKMYQRKFQGSGPPRTPVVQAVPGNNQVKLIWDANAENSVDALTGKNDFEGYKIYRSTDLGKTWGTAVTDQFSDVIGYKPIKIFDKINGIKGRDPAFNQSLGDDSGLKHSYIDKNLVNGIEYWYCVTAYDQGNQITDSLEQSYQSPLGASLMESHTVSAIPGVEAPNYEPPELVPSEGDLKPLGGLCQGIVQVEIIQPQQITGDDYVVTFTDSAREIVGVDTNYVLGFNLDRVSKLTGDTTNVLQRHLFSDKTGDNLPVTDGFRLTLHNSPSGIQSIGWTKVTGDTCTFDWRTGPTEYYLDNPMVVTENIYTTDDLQITIDTTAEGGSRTQWYDFYAGTVQDTIIYLPFKVHIINDPENPIDISDNTWLFEFALKAPYEYRKNYYSPKGWDLIPGGAGFVPGSPGWYEKFADILVLENLLIDPITGDTSYTGLYLQTNNFPDEYVNASGDTVRKKAVAPTHGDQFTIKTYKPFRKEIHYQFNTSKIEFRQSLEPDLNKIRVVPDPYIVSNTWENSQFGKKLMFNHLPNECEISIYTIAGDHIRTINHQNNLGYEFWDMRTYNDQFIAYGLYIYVVTTPSGLKKVGRFLVIK